MKIYIDCQWKSRENFEWEKWSPERIVQIFIETIIFRNRIEMISFFNINFEKIEWTNEKILCVPVSFQM